MRALILFLASLLMAAGITQPGGAGTTVFLEDQAHADASLDGIGGTYSLADLGLKALPSGDYQDLCAWLSATLQKRYGSRVSIQNGDGVGTAVTTLRDVNTGLLFASGKTLLISSVGRANRYIELGEKILGIRNSGKNGCEIISHSALTLQGNLKLYGSTFQSITGAVNLQPTLAGLIGELIECRVKSAGSISIGQPVAPFQEIYNADMVLGNGVTFALTNLCADFCERLTLSLSGPLNARFINTASPLLPRDLVLIGNPTTDVIRYNGPAGGGIVEPTWPQSVPVMTVPPLTPFSDWWRLEPVLADEETGVPLSGCSTQIYRRTGELMLDAASDPVGRLSYGSGVTENCLIARFIDSSLVWDEAWPLTVILNADGALPGYPTRVLTLPWPYKQYLGGSQKQLEPFQPVLALPPIPGPGPTTSEPFYGAAELRVALEELGQDVSVAGVTTKGMLRQRTQEILRGKGTALLALEETVLIESGSLPALAVGIDLSVDGVIYKVARIRQMRDGALTEVLLAREA